MLGVKQRQPVVEPHLRKPLLDDVQAPTAEQDWRVWDLTQKSAVIVPHRGPTGKWLAKLFKAAVKALAWIMDAMCDGMCPWIKKR